MSADLPRPRTTTSLEGKTQMEAALESLRLAALEAINARPRSREELTAEFGQAWDTRELASDYEVVGFLAPFAMVRRRNDGQIGSLAFQHDPRLYFDFKPDSDSDSDPSG